MKRIIYSRPDGGVSVVQPTSEFIARFASEDDAIAYLLPRRVPGDAIESRVIEHTELPDRKFRDALELGPSGPVVNMLKARLIHEGRLEEALGKAVDKRQRDLERAEDDNDNAEAARLRSERKELRDSVQSLDLPGAATPEALDALWPAGVPRDA